MVREELASPSRRRFLNVSTGEWIQADLPELLDHRMLAHTPEGLLVLLREHTHHVRLLNPLTRQLTELPPVTALLSPLSVDRELSAWGSGIANDSTVVLCFTSLGVLGLAKPGDERWTSVDCDFWWDTALMFAGRFYCVARDRDRDVNRVMVLETTGDQPPRLEVAAGLPFWVLPSDSWHLVDNGGELMLVHPSRSHRHTRLRPYGWFRTYGAYRVDLDAGALVPVKSFAGRAVFMGMHRSLSLSTEAFPSIRGDTLYLTFDDDLGPTR